MKVPSWYVITGGPSSGKTTVLQKLQELGYFIVPEAARVFIDEYVKKGISAQELRKDESLFQKQVLEMKLKIEETVPKDRIVFFDRGIPDSIAYFRICGLNTKEVEKISKNRYRKIFFLEQLPFQQDYARIENKKTVKKLNQLLLEAYENLGYTIVHVSVASVEERVRLILSNL